jgi:HD-GYP domain-containing protein (c-di-GMP phosphodiesterase class II)
MQIFDDYGLYIVISLIIIIVVLLSLFKVKNKKIKDLQNKNDTIDEILKAVNPTLDLEVSLVELLTTLSFFIKAPSYAFYIYDDKNKTYILKASRNSMSNDASISPSYSGLLPYKKESFNMPSIFLESNSADEICISKMGEVPLLLIPLKFKKALILVGPIAKIPSKSKKTLQDISDKFSIVLDTLLKTEEIKNKINENVSSNKAVKNVSYIFSDVNAMLKPFLDISIKSINASGCLFLSKKQGEVYLENILGVDNEIQNELKDDTITKNLLFQLLGDKEIAYLTKNNKSFYKIPSYFISEGIEMFLFIKVISDNGVNLLVFWYKEILDIQEHQTTAIKILSKRIGDLINNYNSFSKISYYYLDILKSLAKMIDNLSKYKIGYSKLMYRYSYIIATELNLSKEEIHDIATAAYLSNIGIIGLSDNILNKNSKYTEIEYEKMKLHAEAGASIVEATIGNKKMASYIRHHHERMDGYGYPSKLKGEEIPTGSRIIAVVQTYLAKILGREYRDALSFDDALKQLKLSSGAQLDGKIVDVFINWIDMKRKQADSDLALGRCFEMRCSSKNICISCPAYKDDSKNCWEHKYVNCTDHGNHCASCFIYTEYLNRKRN